MFWTLGNMLLDDRVGLLSVDFLIGRTFQLTGTATIRQWPAEEIHSERTLHIAIHGVRRSWADIGRGSISTRSVLDRVW